MRIQRHRCPDCGLAFDSSWALTDHALTAHVGAPAPALSQQEERRGRRLALRALAVVGVLLGAGFWVAVGLAVFGVFDKETAPLQPSSMAHSVAVALEANGEIDSYRSVEPDEGWDAEYELDGSDGLIRSRGSGPLAAVEYEAFIASDLEDAIIAELERRGYDVE